MMMVVGGNVVEWKWASLEIWVHSLEVGAEGKNVAHLVFLPREGATLRS